jgi:hypothetical protein
MSASSLSDRIKRAIAGALVLASIVAAAAILGGDGGTAGGHWMFLDAASLADLGLAAHGSRSGAWELEEHEAATGGRALANREGEPGAGPALLLALQPKSRDLRARTRCKVMGPPSSPDAPAESPAACGIVFRFVDDRNHWLVRADASAGVVEAAAVVQGQERLLQRARTPRSLDRGAWIDLRIEVRGDVLRASLDGDQVLLAEAPTVPAGIGAMGLWAPSAATVYFDHFTVETLSTAPRALEILPVLGKRPG